MSLERSYNRTRYHGVSAHLRNMRAASGLTNDDLLILAAVMARRERWDEKWLNAVFGALTEADIPEAARQEYAVIEAEETPRLLAIKAKAQGRYLYEDYKGKVIVNLYPYSQFPVAEDKDRHRGCRPDSRGSDLCFCEPELEYHPAGIVMIHHRVDSAP